MAIKYLTKPVFLASLICIFFFYSGLIEIPEKKLLNSLLRNSELVAISGKLISTPVKTSSGKYYSSLIDAKSLSSKTSSSSAFGHIKIYIPSEMIEAYFPGKLFSLSKNKGSFIYEAGAFYHFEGTCSNNEFYVNKCLSCQWPKSFTGKIDYFRALCRLHFKRLMYKWGNGGGLLLALLSGSKEYTEKTTSEAFKNAGLSHILALSGMHLSMFSAISLFLGNIIGRKKISYIIRIIALILFVWFAGFSPSLLRAFICALLSLLSVMTGNKKSDLLLILCFSFLLQSIISPSDIHNIGFIMSYGALAGIIISSSLFKFIYSKAFPNFISNSLAASSGAQIITAPISLKIFGSFAPIGILATSIVSPLITIFIYTGLAMILLSLIIPILEGPSGIFVNLQYNIIKYLVLFFSRVPKWSVNIQ
ncbi:MAG: ComEC/Rec2 family competence protein [Treponema sp.]|nr:ComEC/Rec2 family competence protein [Treponema sp.]